MKHGLGVDELGRYAFHQLAQQSWAHHVEAVAIVAKLCKKMGEGEPAHNPSAFVTKGCLNAMHINKLFDNCLRQRLRASQNCECST